MDRATSLPIRHKTRKLVGSIAPPPRDRGDDGQRRGTTGVNLAKGFGGRYSELYTTGAWTQVPSALVTLSGGKHQRPPEEWAGRARARSKSAYVPDRKA